MPKCNVAVAIKETKTVINSLPGFFQKISNSILDCA